jgi:galactokinase
LLVGTCEGIFAQARRFPGFLRIRSTIEGHRSDWLEIPFEAEALLAEARSGSFFSYAAGVAFQVLARHPVQGIEIDNHRTDLPVKKGLSSSAALCVLVTRAFNKLFDLGLSLRDEMDLAYLGETTTPSRCGRLDQGCAFGSRVVRMVFDGDAWDAQAVPVGAPMHLVLADLRAAKDTRRILADLQSCYPLAGNGIARDVQEGLGGCNEALVARAESVLARGDAEALGATMTEAQRSFDRLVAPACPMELRAPALHALLANPEVGRLVFGGKGVGSQGDGAAQFVARDAACRDALVELLTHGLGLGASVIDLEATIREPESLEADTR